MLSFFPTLPTAIDFFPPFFEMITHPPNALILTLMIFSSVAQFTVGILLSVQAVEYDAALRKGIFSLSRPTPACCFPQRCITNLSEHRLFQFALEIESSTEDFSSHSLCVFPNTSKVKLECGNGFHYCTLSGAPKCDAAGLKELSPVLQSANVFDVDVHTATGSMSIVAAFLFFVAIVSLLTSGACELDRSKRIFRDKFFKILSPCFALTILVPCFILTTLVFVADQSTIDLSQFAVTSFMSDNTSSFTSSVVPLSNTTTFNGSSCEFSGETVVSIAWKGNTTSTNTLRNSVALQIVDSLSTMSKAGRIVQACSTALLVLNALPCILTGCLVCCSMITQTRQDHT